LPTFAALPDPVFTDQDGHPFNRQRMQGKVWVADFIFTTCAMACPILTARMGKIQSRLKDEDPNIQLVSFSILPETDTPPVLKAYGAPFHQDPARWAMVTGPVDPVLNPVSEGFTKAVKTAPGLLVSGDSNFTSQHGEMFILIDQTGHVRGYYRKDDAQVDQLITDAKHLAALKS
jgi:protein SCO1/2